MLGLPEGGADEVDGIGVQSIDMYLSFDFSVDCFPSLPATECKRHKSVEFLSNAIENSCLVCDAKQDHCKVNKK